MRVLYGIILITLILQQLSWACPIEDEISFTVFANNHHDNSDKTSNGNPTMVVISAQTDDKDNKHNPENLRGLG